LTLLNQHKRTHNQDESSHSDTVTVVTPTTGQIIQAQNLINENGQSLGQIQIVAADSLEPAQLHQLQGENFSIVQQSSGQKSIVDKSKCVSCGGQLPQNTKRKGPKLIRCENCIHNDSSAQQQQHHQQSSRPTQIFVSPDGEVKFEVNEMNHNVIQIQQKQPVKKKPVTTLTKCTTCNGTGMVVVPESQSIVVPVTSPIANTTSHSTKATSNVAQTITNVTTSPQKIQQIRVSQIKSSSPPPPPPVIHQVQHHAPPANQGARQIE
jgi:KRAB domain-containing zinc finger protein